MIRRYSVIPSPVGDLLLAKSGETLSEVRFGTRGEFDIPSDWEYSPEAFREVREQLDAYFAGKLRRFDLALAMQGTEFQKLVWEALLLVPYGATTTYGEIAKRIGRPAAVRAVGAANGSNPIPIIVPCHRIIGRSGRLTGYGGGIEIKRWLLLHEGAIRDDGAEQLALI
jgi:methylated-DNA-[protein]-cysteine S-methyltransferase